MLAGRLMDEVGDELFFEPPPLCHFDRPTGAEKPLHFADACTTEEVKVTSCTPLPEMPICQSQSMLSLQASVSLEESQNTGVS